MAIWLRTNEFEEAVQSFESCLEFAIKATGDLSYWKWTMISLHNALQGFMVISLRRSDGFGPIRDDIEKEWHEARSKGHQLPVEKLDSFLNLYKKIKKEGSLQYSNEERFIPKGNQGHSVKKVNEIRDEFIHFTPKGWSLECSGLPNCCLDCLQIARFLHENCRNISTRSGYDRDRVIRVLSELEKVFSDLKTQYTNTEPSKRVDA